MPQVKTRVQTKLSTGVKVAIALVFIGGLGLAAGFAGVKLDKNKIFSTSKQTAQVKNLAIDLEAFGLSAKSTMFPEGAGFTFTATIRNNSTNDINSPFQVALYRENYNDKPLKSLHTFYFKSLKASEEKQVTDTAILPKETEDVTTGYLVMADSANELNETDENNNRYWLGSTVLSSANTNDVGVRNLKITKSGESNHAVASFDVINYSAKNITEWIDVNLLRKLVANVDQYGALYSGSLGDLPAGRQKSFSHTFITASEFTNELKVVIDADNNFVESNKSNNTMKYPK